MSALSRSFPKTLPVTTNSIVGIGALFLLAMSFVAKKSGLVNLVFYPKSLKDIHFEGVTPVMTFGLAVLNTSSQAYTLNSMAGKLYANNYEIGTVSNFTPQKIFANGQSVVYFNCRLGLLGVVSDIINSIQNKTYSQALELESHANVDNLQIPINLKFQFKVGG